MHCELYEQVFLAFKDLKALVVRMVYVDYQVVLARLDLKDKRVMLDRLEILVHKEN